MDASGGAMGFVFLPTLAVALASARATVLCLPTAKAGRLAWPIYSAGVVIETS